MEKIQEYYSISEITEENIKLNIPPQKLTSIEEQERTEEIVKECQQLIEEAYKIFEENNIPFRLIQLSSNIGFFCTKELITFLKQQYESNVDKSHLHNLPFSELKSKMSFQYVPIKFSINMVGSETTDGEDIDSFIDRENIQGLNSITCKTISGTINLEQFINLIQELGYSINLLNYGECKNIYDYIEAVKINDFDTLISIEAHFKKKNNKKLTLEQ